MKLSTRKHINELIKSTLLSIAVFGTVTLLSYVLTLQHENWFKLGLPWKFYYQFTVDNDLQHGSDLVNLVKDCALTWIVTVMTWMLIKRIIGKAQLPTPLTPTTGPLHRKAQA